LSVDPEKLSLCSFGLHASYRATDAIQYAPGPIVCRVKLKGKCLVDNDKICAEKREVLWMADASNVLHEFACVVAEQTLGAAGVDDDRCWDAIAVKRSWMAGTSTTEDLRIARVAASYAARDAARDAASYAARYAAWDAAKYAARDAAWYAALSEMNVVLEEMLWELKP